MGKVGKKTKKFVKKHLKSALKTRRIFKSTRNSIRRRNSTAGKIGGDDQQGGQEGDQLIASNVGSTTLNITGNSFLDGLVSEDDDTSLEDDSGSDNYLSEDSNCPYISGSDIDNDIEDNGENLNLEGNNSKIRVELAQQKKRLHRLKKKDPKFSKFLERHKHTIENLINEENHSDEEVEKDNQRVETIEAHACVKAKLISSSTLDVWCWLVMEEGNISALSGLVNGYRTACHYCLDDSNEYGRYKLSNGAFSKILMFMLYEADGIFRKLLGLSNSSCKETILRLKNISQWKATRPFLKSYLRSTLFLLNQLTDNNVLVFAVSQLRQSVIFFTHFPLLLKRLLKIVVHLWATGEQSLFSSSFLLIRDMALQLSANCLDACLRRIYKAFLARCKFVEPENLKHLEYLGESIVELYSLDVHKSYQRVLDSLQQIWSVLQYALKTKKKEEIKKISSWQFIKSIDIWVKFISLNSRDYDLKPLLYMVVQIVTGVAQLFPGPRYLPVRIRCVQMLNQLSSSSGFFIPVIYLVLDFLDYGEKLGSGANQPKAVRISSVLKAPKPWLKSRDFQEECIRYSIELLSEHFSQWSYHISFPDLATIPLILLKRFYQNLKVESLRRPVKRLIDQVERNSEFVQRKRDQTSISINDRASTESFLQAEKVATILLSLCITTASKRR